MTSPVKVLHIVGSWRAGSTILGNLLGEVDTFLHVGELRNLWKNLLLGRMCGCGRPLPECPLWSGACDGRFGTLPDPVVVRRWQEETLRTIHLPRKIASGPKSAVRVGTLDSYRRTLAQLYRALAETTETRVIVDSSKSPSHAAGRRYRAWSPTSSTSCGILGGLRSRIRAAVLMREASGSNATNKRLHPALDGWGWTKVNMAAEVVCHRAGRGRFLRLRYEDFVRDPLRTLEDVLALVDERSRELPILSDRTVLLAANHTVGGNSNRFRSGPVEIKQDTRRLEAMERGDRILTTMVTLPLLRRYGYRVDGVTRSSQERSFIAPLRLSG
jgi:hypothetical protein